MDSARRSGFAVEHGPTISVVVAAYNRCRLLRHALASVLAQDFGDFEVLVIGDACTDESGEVVASFGDPRLSFRNLPVNFGDQSGPNNIGIARARGRYIAFLNQDDMWLPDHLSVCLEWLEATGADIVHAAAAGISADSTARKASHWIAGHGDTANGTFFDPCRDFAPCSCWLTRAELFGRIGGFRPALECFIEPSQDLLFRAWRAGLVHRAVPNLSVVVLASGQRAGSYLAAGSAEHDEIAALIRRPGARGEILARMAARDPPLAQRWWSAVSAAMLRPVAWAGIPPRALRHHHRHRFRRGNLIQRLRGIRGLAPVWHASGGLAAIRLRDIAGGPAYELGTRLDFGLAGGPGVRERGWSSPQAGGTWTDGSQACVVFRLAGDVPPGDLQLDIEATAFLAAAHPRQRIVFRVGDTELAEVVMTADRSGPLPPVRIPARLRPPGGLLRIVLDLPDACVPTRLGVSQDKRRLALMVQAMTLTYPDAAAPVPDDAPA